MKVVMPSKKKSQWNPGGFRRGNSDPCAMSDCIAMDISVCIVWRTSILTETLASK